MLVWDLLSSSFSSTNLAGWCRTYSATSFCTSSNSPNWWNFQWCINKKYLPIIIIDLIFNQGTNFFSVYQLLYKMNAINMKIFVSGKSHPLVNFYEGYWVREICECETKGFTPDPIWYEVHKGTTRLALNEHEGWVPTSTCLTNFYAQAQNYKMIHQLVTLTLDLHAKNYM